MSNPSPKWENAFLDEECRSFSSLGRSTNSREANRVESYS